jgi:hypothetical protein
VVEKFCDGLPLTRIEDRLGRDGVPVGAELATQVVRCVGSSAGHDRAWGWVGQK